MSALLFGSISTLADTSELQRSAFNDAFAQHGLDWEWGREEYQSLLTGNGGADRIAAYAEERGDTVDAAQVHEAKSQLFRATLATQPLTARPGVVEAVEQARAAGWSVGLVTTTSRDNVDAILAAVGDLSADDFTVITDVTTVSASKPSPAVYEHVLEDLGETADGVVAIEDNVGGVQAASEAGITCLAFPNENTEGHDFGGVEVVDRISFEDVAVRAGAGR